MCLSEDHSYKDSPFGEGGHDCFNACVGRNGGPYNYYDYARGYFSAGHKVCNYVFENHGWEIDILIYPILYNYRHAIELSLKNVISISEDESNISTHRLPNLYNKAEEYIKESLKDEEESAEEILTFIEKFNEVDPTAEVARFPEDRKGVLFLQDMFIINIEPIYDKARKLEQMFSFINSKIKEKQDIEKEI